MIPSGQDWLIKPMQALGYKADANGICFGIEHMGMQAILCQDLDSFDKRFQIIYDHLSSFDSINKKRLQSIEAVNKGLPETLNETLNAQETTLIRHTEAFFCGVELYQNLKNYNYLLPKKSSLQLQNALTTSTFVLPEILLQKGGIVKTRDFSGIYTQEELTAYFNHLRQTIKKNKNITEPIVFILQNSIHAITVGYDVKEDQWYFIDVNQLPSQTISDDEEMASKVMAGFFSHGIATFSTQIYSVKTIEHFLEETIQKLENQDTWKKIHAVSSEKARLLDTNSNSWLYIAARNGHLNIVQELLAHGANVNAACKNDGATALYIATQENHLEIVQALLAHGADVNAACTDDSTTPLFMAAQNSHLAIVKELLAHGADINAACKNGVTALYIAAQNGHLEIVQALLAHSANVNAACTDDDTSALYIAAQNSHLEVVKELLAYGANVNAARKNGVTALHIAAQNGHLEIVKELLSYGANVNAARTDNGGTALYAATQKNRAEIVSLLLKQGANVDLPLNKMWTPLHKACENNNDYIIKLLLNYGANLLKKGDGNKTPVDMTTDPATKEKLLKLQSIFSHSSSQEFESQKMASKIYAILIRDIDSYASTNLMDTIDKILNQSMDDFTKVAAIKQTVIHHYYQMKIAQNSHSGLFSYHNLITDDLKNLIIHAMEHTIPANIDKNTPIPVIPLTPVFNLRTASCFPLKK